MANEIQGTTGKWSEVLLKRKHRNKNPNEAFHRIADELGSR
jgi:hypothetical protein